MMGHQQAPTRSAPVGVVIFLVLPALLALWVIWIWLGHVPTGGLGLLYHSLR